MYENIVVQLKIQKIHLMNETTMLVENVVF